MFNEILFQLAILLIHQNVLRKLKLLVVQLFSMISCLLTKPLQQENLNYLQVVLSKALFLTVIQPQGQIASLKQRQQELISQMI
jgi:hypothetical protein